MGPGMIYTMIRPGKDPEGGLMQSQVPNAPSFWLTYVDVDDVKAATAKALSLGATVMKDVTEVPDGLFTITTDPTGARWGSSAYTRAWMKPGTRLGAYEITGALGAGGMGEVYRAARSRLGREVALKILPAGRAADPALLDRFTPRGPGALPPSPIPTSSRLLRSRRPTASTS